MNVDIFYPQSGQVRQASALYRRLPHGAVIPCGDNRVRVRAWNDERTIAYETFAFSVGAVHLPDDVFNPPFIIPAFAARIERRLVNPDEALTFTLRIARNSDNDDVQLHVNVDTVDASSAYFAKAVRSTALQYVTVTLLRDELYALIDARRAVTRVRFGVRGGWACLKTRNATLWKRNIAPTEHAP